MTVKLLGDFFVGGKIEKSILSMPLCRVGYTLSQT